MGDLITALSISLVLQTVISLILVLRLFGQSQSSKELEARLHSSAVELAIVKGELSLAKESEKHAREFLTFVNNNNTGK